MYIHIIAGLSSPGFQPPKFAAASQPKISPRSSAHSELIADRLNAVARELFDLQEYVEYELTLGGP